MTEQLHPVLRRQVRNLGLDERDARLYPLLERVSRSYADADQDRYTMERSLSVVSDEMRVLYEDLRIRSDAMHAATIEASPDGVLVVDERRRVLSYNRAFTEIWRVSPDVAARRDDEEVLNQGIRLLADPAGFVARVDELYAEPLATAREELVFLDGRIIDRATAPVLAAGSASRVLGRVWFFRDVTDAKRHEAELSRARDDAERASKAKSAFLANMSHELRTPLNSILGFGRLLRRAGALDADQKEYIELVVKAGEHMLGLVNDLLDLRKLEDAPVKLERVAVDVGVAVGEAGQLVRPLLCAQNHRFSVDVEAGVTALADRRALVQILVNLLSNAAKFTPPGNGAISVVAARRGDRVEVRVKDNGIGIPTNSIDKLFTYYAQLDGKSHLGMKGSGIGLALTRAMLQSLGGDISVESTAGVGSTFRFALPAAPPVSQARAAVEP